MYVDSVPHWLQYLYKANTYAVKSVKRVVYSTCSIHAEEDEHVIMKALASKEAKARGWTLAPRSEVLPAWERRGRPSEMGDNKGASLSQPRVHDERVCF